MINIRYLKMKNIKKQKKIIILFLILVLLTAVLIPLCSRKLDVSRYTISDQKIKSPFRIVQISDLHSCKYGKNEEELIQKIKEQDPDIAVLTGDIFDDVNENTNTEIFLKNISELYPSYYVTGNHESRVDPAEYNIKMEILKKYNVKILRHDKEEITYGQNARLDLYGIDDDELYYYDPQNENRDFNEDIENLSRSVENDVYSVLLSHKPNHMDEYYSKQNFDLVLCGHAHGGQIRIPGVINGVFAPDQGLFPKYTKGIYKKNNTTMIVSTGLSKKYPLVPRFCNRPEIVLIELKPLSLSDTVQTQYKQKSEHLQ